MTKKFCPSCSISQEPYIRWLSFMVHICKMIISPVIFFNFSKFWFSRVSGGRGGGVKGLKKAQKDKKLSVAPYISGTIYHMIFVDGTNVVNKISSGIFFIVSKFWFSGSLGGWKSKKMAQMTKKNSVYLTLYLRNGTSYDCDSPAIFFHFFKILIFGVFRG